MIKGNSGERQTPKQKAQEVIMLAITKAFYELDAENLTNREILQVSSQVQKQKERIEKMFGYDVGSWSFD